MLKRAQFHRFLKKEQPILNSCSEIYGACYHKISFHRFCTDECLEGHESVPFLPESPTRTSTHENSARKDSLGIYSENENEMDSERMFSDQPMIFHQVKKNKSERNKTSLINQCDNLAEKCNAKIPAQKQ